MSKRNLEEDTKIILSCLETLGKSKTGAALIKFALEHEVAFYFDDHQKSLGYFTPQHNAVALSGKLTTLEMVGVLSHELRHAQQHHSGFAITTEYSPDDMVFLSAIMEADAEAHHAQVAKELEEEGYPEVMEAHLKTAYAIIQETYNSKIKETNDANLAKKEAFDAWFKIKNIRNGYANNILGFAFYASLELASQAKKGFKKLKNNFLKTLGSSADKTDNYLKETKLRVNKYKCGGLHKRFRMMMKVFRAGLKSIAAPKNMRCKIFAPLFEYKMR